MSNRLSRFGNFLLRHVFFHSRLDQTIVDDYDRLKILFQNIKLEPTIVDDYDRLFYFSLFARIE